MNIQAILSVLHAMGVQAKQNCNGHILIESVSLDFIRGFIAGVNAHNFNSGVWLIAEVSVKANCFVIRPEIPA